MGKDGARACFDLSLTDLVANLLATLTEHCVTDKYLLIDASTPAVQCGFARLDEGPKNVLCGYGDVLESLNRLISELIRGCSFQELAGIIYCYGPGSTLGLRSCVTMINVWQTLCPTALRLFRYSSLDMAANIVGFDRSIVASIGNGGYFIKNKEYVFAEEIPPDALFLQTRRLKPNCSNELVDYKISGYRGSISEILTEVKHPEIFNFKEKEFVKWDQRRHSSNKI